MLFNSLEFLLFLPAVVLLYYAVPHRFRRVLLLAASYYFYAAWKPEYLVLIVASTGIDYVAGLGMAAQKERRGRRKYLLMSLVGNLGMLMGFKYFNFFSDSVRVVLESMNVFADVPYLQLGLPVGISFYTFQSLSYTIDLYRGEREVERHLGIFALYVAFFPQLVAGPIERSTHLMPQLRARHRFDYGRVTSGLRLILWGFFKKVVIADSLNLFVRQVYDAPEQWHGPAVLVATYLFAFQIFCDFSGYTDIARGSARIMGYDLMENFNRPYFARSIREFWGRWHISLSTWFRDYLYIPLGGNRVVKWRWYYNLMVVFVVSGLWHGANWTFVVWGFLHGGYMVLGILSTGWRDRGWGFMDRVLPRSSGWLRQAVAVFLTFQLVTVAWIFFRAHTLSDALLLIGSLTDWSGGLQGLTGALDPITFVPALLALVIMETVHVIQEWKGREVVTKRLLAAPGWMRWAVYYVLVMYILAFGQVQDARQFIYFQF